MRHRPRRPAEGAGRPGDRARLYRGRATAEPLIPNRHPGPAPWHRSFLPRQGEVAPPKAVTEGEVRARVVGRDVPFCPLRHACGMPPPPGGGGSCDPAEVRSTTAGRTPGRAPSSAHP
ncbi:hypothetical protein D9602_04880 [Sphingomonas sp. TX0522]|nr:hypothetical protein [Sphingomonas sp. TX0522]